MRLFGLIGYPLGHSFSKKYFTQKFKQEQIPNSQYDLFPLKNISLFRELLLAHPNLKGLNVTIPYKQLVIPFLDDLNVEAKEVNAVNTIKFLPNGTTCGYNTDIYGFEKSLHPLLQKHHNHALILGTGGAAKAVAYILKKLGINYKMVSRNPSTNTQQISYNAIDAATMQQHLLIINTTPLGMHPHEESCPNIPYALTTKHHLFYDLVYNPECTAFLAKGKTKQANTKNGLEMLYLQAERAWEIWNE